MRLLTIELDDEKKQTTLMYRHTLMASMNAQFMLRSNMIGVGVSFDVPVFGVLQPCHIRALLTVVDELPLSIDGRNVIVRPSPFIVANPSQQSVVWMWTLVTVVNQRFKSVYTASSEQSKERLNDTRTYWITTGEWRYQRRLKAALSHIAELRGRAVPVVGQRKHVSEYFNSVLLRTICFITIVRPHRNASTAAVLSRCSGVSVYEHFMWDISNWKNKINPTRMYYRRIKNILCHLPFSPCTNKTYSTSKLTLVNDVSKQRRS